MSVLRNLSMNRSHTFANVFRAASVLLLLLALRAPSLAAQGLDPSALLQKQATDTWPTYNGDYSGKRYSPLDQINASNVSSQSIGLMRRCASQNKIAMMTDVPPADSVMSCFMLPEISVTNAGRPV